MSPQNSIASRDIFSKFNYFLFKGASTVSSSQYRHVIWDWNGTLVDDVWLSHDIVNSFLISCGVDSITLERYRETFSHPISDFYRKLGLTCSQEELAQVAENFLTTYQERFSSCRLYGGARELIASLKKCGYTQSLLSAHPHELLLENLTSIEMISAFDQIVGLDNHTGNSKVSRGKALLRQLPYSPAEIVMIGDTDHDYEVASTLGVDCILISSGYQSNCKLRCLDARLFDSLEEMIASGILI